MNEAQVNGMQTDGAQAKRRWTRRRRMGRGGRRRQRGT